MAILQLIMGGFGVLAAVISVACFCLHLKQESERAADFESGHKDEYRVIDKHEKKNHQGKVVFVSGAIQKDSVFDDELNVEWPGNIQILLIDRSTEVYQWEEEVVDFHEKVGPSAWRT